MRRNPLDHRPLPAEIPQVGLSDRYQVYAVFFVSVPIDWPLDDFHDRVSAIADCLRIRWGVAGYTYSDWIPFDYRTAWDAKFAHARRHPGADVAEYASIARRWHDELRTVSWLTWLGPAFVEKLMGFGRSFDSTPLLDVTRSGDGVRIRAGAAPELGDANRIQMPTACVAADQLVRPLRARANLDFGGLWTEATTAAWLRRFEGVTS